jgi:Viral BACON domain
VFQAASGSVTVPVSVIVGSNILSQVNAIAFTKVFGGANPLPQTLTIASTGTNFNVDISFSNATGGNWLSVSPAAGCCYATPQAVTAIVNASPTLAVGMYTAQIVITSQGGAMAITIPVTLTVAAAGGTYLDNLPGQMSFSLKTAGTIVTSQDIQIRNGGSGTLNWTAMASTSDAGSWLSVSAPSGTTPSYVTVHVSVPNLPNGGLIAGTFTGELVFQTAGSSVTVPVSVVVGDNVLSQVSAIAFTKVFGGANPLPQILTIPSTGTNFNVAISFTNATGGNWLSVSPAAGCCYATPQVVTAIVNASPTLAVGTYTAQIVITSQGGAMAITIPVTLTVAAASVPFFDNVPGQMSFSLKTGSSNNPPPQSIQIRNAGAGTLDWTLTTSTSDGGNWLSASALSGTAPSRVSIAVLKENLPGLGLIAGTFIGELVFRTTAGSSVTVAVSVVVGTSVFNQVNAISFTKVFGGANPLPQTLTIASTGTNFNVDISFSNATGGNWLSVSPAAGCCYATPQVVTAIVNASTTLAVGTYTAQIVLTSQGGAMAITIPVTLTVAAASAPFFDNVPGQMSFSFVTGSGNPPAQTVQIRNAGLGTLPWTLAASTSDGGNWLSASPASGNAPTTITVGITASALPGQGLVAGTFIGELVFQSAGSSVTIPVSVVVGSNVFVQLGTLTFTKPFGGQNPLPQTVSIASTGTNFNFALASSTATGGNWLSVTPAAGCCYATPRAITATITASPTLAAGTYTAQMVFTSQGGAMAMTVPVILNITPPAPPFGVFDTPRNGVTGLAGAFAVGGWALSTVGVANVGLWREPIGNEPAAANGLVFMVNATTIAGSRPDVAAAFPSYPNNNFGWGAQILTTGLPGTNGLPQGNGTYKIHAIATDTTGLTADIAGPITVSVNNAASRLPFGTIDTPTQGGTASGTAFVNFGWILTPQPNIVSMDGSTITVYIDDQPVGHPTYNFSRCDITFQGLRNSGSTDCTKNGTSPGPVGFFTIDTTKLTNGLHSIQWGVSDSGGNVQGIGSRFFIVQN